LTIKDFANIVDVRSELNDAVFKQVTAIQNKRNVELAKLKQAWREAEGLVARGLKRSAEGVEEESLDEPLHVDVQRNIEKEFTKYYKFTIKPNKMGCDTLLGRVKREFDKGRVTIFPLNRVRSLAHVSKDLPQKRQKISEQLVVEFIGNQEYEMYSDIKDTNRVFMLINQLNILSTTWAVAGCFDTTSQGKDGAFQKYAHWQDCTEYVEEIEKRAIKLLPSCKETSVATFIVELDAHLRAAAIDLVRTEEVDSFGAALKQAVKDQYHVFKEFEDAVEPRANFTSNIWERQRKNVRQAQEEKGNTRAKGPNKGAGKNKKGQKNQKGGAKGGGKGAICSPFNSKPGCKNASCEKRHLCSYRKKDGSFCNSSKHGKMDHPNND
jgi:hypothetical protein